MKLCILVRESSIFSCVLFMLMMPHCFGDNLKLHDSIGGRLVGIQKTNNIYFVAQSNVVKLIGASLPHKCIKIISLNGNVSSISIHGNILFIAKSIFGSTYGEIIQYNISDPTHPVSIGELKEHTAFNDNAHLFVQDNMLMVDKGPNSLRVDIYDLTKPDNILKVATWSANSESVQQYDTLVKERYKHDGNLLNDPDALRALRSFIGIENVASVTNYGDFIIALDTSSSLMVFKKNESGISIDTVYPLRQPFGKIKVYGKMAYAFGGKSNQLAVIDISDATSITTRSYITFPSTIRSIDCSSEILYVVGDFGVCVYDMKLGAAPLLIASVKLKNSLLSEVIANEPYAYVAGDSFYVLKRKGSSLEVISRIPAKNEFDSRHIAKQGNVVYSLGSNGAGYESNFAIDITDAVKPKVKPVFNHSLFGTQFSHICVFQSYLCLVEHSMRTGFHGYGLGIYEPSGSFKLLSQYNNIQEVKDLATDNQYIYVAEGEGGLQIFGMEK